MKRMLAEVFLETAYQRKKRMDKQVHRENTLIERLNETIRFNPHPTGEYTWHHHTAFPPVTEEHLAHTEAQLGFELPSFLRRLYLEVGNGGFGPGYGLFPLNDHRSGETIHSDSLLGAYLGMRSMSQKDIDEHYADEEEKPALWPERALMLCDWGCNIYSCLNCSSPELPILRMDININFMVEWAIEAPSLQQWLKAWVDGKPLFDLIWEQATKVSVSHLGRAF
jgi:SMI1 / KNR4 family (SUKH-1)